jgi:tetratricopeptide (TPR) repeat protein
MHCTRCGSDNPAGTKFCIECGIPLKYWCPHCGAEDLPQAKFCGACGMPLQVTITFVPKLVGKTSLRLLKSVPLIGEIVSKVLLPVVLLVVLSIVLMGGLLWSWQSGGNSITITSFTETSGDKGRGVGHALADALESEILRIAQLHTLKNPWGRSQEVPSLEMTGPQTVERGGGTISFAGIELPLEVIAQALKPWFIRSRTQYVITGSLQRVPSGDDTPVHAAGGTKEVDCRNFPSGKGIRVHLIVRLEEDGRMRKRWSCMVRLSGDADSDADIHSALAQYLRKIAFEITWITLEGIEASSLENFKDFIEGVDLFRQYKDKNYNAFDTAEQALSRAVEQNAGYARAHFFLGNLYSWRAHYEQDADGARTFEEWAKSEYEKTGRGATTNPDEARALRNFGIGLIDYRHYLKVKKNHLSSMQQVYKRLEDAGKAFTAAWEQDHAFYFARTGRALVYKEKANLLNQAGEKTGTAGCLNYAIREFQYAKDAAADLKDMDSVKWIDKQMLALELEKQGVRDTEDRGSQFLVVFGGLVNRWRTCPDLNAVLSPPFPPKGV